MWCGQCQADVAAEVSSDNQRVFCTICGALLSTIDSPPARPSTERSDKTKDARELLQRWSSGKVLDPFGPPMQRREFAESNSPPSLLTNVAPDATPTWHLLLRSRLLVRHQPDHARPRRPDLNAESVFPVSFV